MGNLVERMVDQIYFRNNMDRIVEENVSETTKEAMIAINKAYEEAKQRKGRERYEAELEIAKMLDELFPDCDKDQEMELAMKAYDLCDNNILSSPRISSYAYDEEKKLEAIKERLRMEENICE